MSKLLLIRHGQASFLSDNYDRLSPHGETQSAQIGQHLLDLDLRVDRAYCGTLERQRRTGELAADRYRSGGAFPELETHAGLDEFASEQLMGVLLPVLCRSNPAIDGLWRAYEAADNDRDRYRRVHHLLEAVMLAWIGENFDRGETPGLPRWLEFASAVRDALAEIRQGAASGSTLAVFTSGGPIGVAVQSALAAPDVAAAALNWRIYNASITEFTFSTGRIALDSFNSIGHISLSARTYR